MPEPISELLPLVRVTTYLEAHVAGFKGPVKANKTATGQSNPTFILTAASGRYVLRRKPPGVLLKSAHAVEREFRVMQALADTPVPVPQMLHLCEDPDVIGAAFFVMSHVAGETYNDPRCPGLDNAQRSAVYDNMNAALAALHAVDIDACGLADYGKPGNYFERQFSRWVGQYRATETEVISPMEDLVSWLNANMPAEDGRVALVHGDWRIDNLLFGHKSSILRAVLDWELSTLGHPFADLGAQIMQWQMPPGEEGRGLAGVDRTALGIPSDQAFTEAYAERSGLSDVPDLRFPVAFAFFRMAAILQGVKKRALDGNASNPEKGLRLGAFVPLIADLALQSLNAEA